jgi:hypothetical protein
MPVFEFHESVSSPVPLCACNYIITSCYFKVHDLVKDAVTVFLIGLVCRSFEVLLQSSVLCSLCEHPLKSKTKFTVCQYFAKEYF